MTASALKKFIKEQTPGTIILMTGDDNIQSFWVKVGTDINIEDIVEYGDDEIDQFLKVKGFILNKKTGKRDIPVTTYRDLTTIRDIMVLDNPNDKQFIDAGDLYAI